MNAALTGLGLAGKTCLFDALAGGTIDSAAHPARPDHPNVASVALPDERLDWLVELYEATKRTPVHVDLMDLPGLAPGRPDFKPANTAITEHLRRADALVYVLRAFEDARAPHPEGRVDPAADAAKLFGEFLIADLDVTLRRIEKLEKQVARPTPERDAHQRELALLEKVRECLESERPVSEAVRSDADRAALRGFTFLTEKPVLAVLNVDEDHAGGPDEAQAVRAWSGLPGHRGQAPVVALAASLEAEIGQLDPRERPAFLEEMGLKRFHTPQVLHGIHDALDRITFYTCSEKEVTARSLPRGSAAIEAAADVHTDMAAGFIRAEVVAYEYLRHAGTTKEARAAGHVRAEGRDYVVQDGDIIFFHFTR